MCSRSILCACKAMGQRKAGKQYRKDERGDSTGGQQEHQCSHHRGCEPLCPGLEGRPVRGQMRFPAKELHHGCDVHGSACGEKDDAAQQGEKILPAMQWFAEFRQEEGEEHHRPVAGQQPPKQHYSLR